MADQVQEVKQKADIVAIVGERVKLKKAGRNWVGLCPFHSEKTPSFNVSPELQIFKCFGCGEAGDVFSFLEKFEGMEFPEALRYVADKVGVKLEAFRPSREYAARERGLEILNLAAEFYHFLLMEHRVGEEARAYLRERGVWKKTAEVFGLGYAPKSWEAVQKYLVGRKKYKPEELERVGLVIRSSKFKVQSSKFYDRFRGRVMFSLTNQRGQVVGLAGRLLDPEVKDSPSSAGRRTSAERGAKYINTPETAFYHKSELLYGLSVTKQEIKKEDRAVVVEGEFDAISSWQAGVKNVVAIKGSALTEEQIRLLMRYTKNVSLALDADSAGTEATKRGIAVADKLGLNLRVVEIKGGKDPDEIVRGSKEEWQKLVKKAVNVYDFYLRSTLKKWDTTSGEGKRRISEEMAPILAQIDNQVEQAHYVRKLAEALGVGEEVVAREVERVGRLVTYKVEEEGPKQEEKVGIEEYVLGLVLRAGEAMFGWVKMIKLEWLERRAVKRVVKILSEERTRELVKNEEFDIGKFVASLPEELKELTQRVWLMSGREGDKVKLEREFEKAMRELQRGFWRKKLQTLSEKIEELERVKKRSEVEKESLRQLQREFVEASRELVILG